MLTSQVFLRYFQSDENCNEIPDTEVFVSVADLDYSGCPIDDDGNNFDHDGLVYFKVSDKEDKYEVIGGNKFNDSVIESGEDMEN